MAGKYGGVAHGATISISPPASTGKRGPPKTERKLGQEWGIGLFVPVMQRRWFLLCLAPLVVSCDNDTVDVRKEFPPPRLAVVEAVTGGRARFEATAESRVEFLMKSGDGRVEGTMPAARGWMTIDLRDMSSLRGRLDVDATRLSTTQTVPALDLTALRKVLELGTELHDVASFSLQEVVSSSARVPRNGRRERKSDGDGEAAGETRYVVDVRVRGDLQLHGYRTATEADLRLTFGYDSNDPSGGPRYVEVRTAKSLQLKPRTFGLQFDSDDETAQRMTRALLVDVDARFLHRDATD